MDQMAVATRNVERKDLIVTRVFDAPVERTWKTWSDPGQVIRWWNPRG